MANGKDNNSPPSGDNGYEDEGYHPQEAHEETVIEATGPAVAATANKNLLLIALGGVLGLFLLYQIFSGGDEEVAPPPPPVNMGGGSAGAPVAPPEEVPIPTATVIPPPFPAPPPLQTSESDLPPPPPPPTVNPDIDFGGDGPNNEEIKKRRSSEMLIVSGTPKTSEEKQNDYTTTAERAVATQVGNLDQLVLQGKVIDAVLETALDTTLAGPLRAVVSRDVYAESGYGVLVPKGSRLIGTYNTDVVRGQGRVFIIWSRLIRPDGVDIQLNSQGVDRLGRAGMPGFVDDRYFEIFGGAILTSILGITIAGVSDAILSPEPTTTTQGTDGSTTTTGSAVNDAINEAVTSVGEVSKNVVGGLLDTRPSITVDQGTPIKVFVNRDLEFPKNVTNSVKVIQ